jgi:enamine deaminase RidA (YjgF/YER057c/UK114 family)
VNGVGDPVSAYSHVACAGDLLFVAGQCGLDENNVTVGDDVTTQTPQAYENVRVILESQGASLRDVMKFSTYLTSAADIPAFYAARDEYFAEHYPDGLFPPNTLLITGGMVRPELRLEIDTWAWRHSGGSNP